MIFCRLLNDCLQARVESFDFVEEKYHTAADWAVHHIGVFVRPDIDFLSRLWVPKRLSGVYDNTMHSNAFDVWSILLQKLYQQAKAEKLGKQV